MYSGLGAAIPACIAAASRLEKDKIASIEKVETGMVEVSDQEGKVRNVCQLRILVAVNPQARENNQNSA